MSDDHTVTFSYVVGEETIPLSAFAQGLSGLQAIVKYLHEQKAYTFSFIATLLNRNPRTIWTTYAGVKHLPLSIEQTGASIPIELFSSRKLSVLEHLVLYLREEGHSFSTIARLLHKDPRTIWTVHNRSRNKGVEHA